MERLFEERTILDDPPVDGRVIHRHPPFFHKFFDMARAQRGGHMALSQILICRCCEACFALPGRSLHGEGVELFGRSEALFTAPCKLPFAQHVHQLNAG